MLEKALHRWEVQVLWVTSEDLCDLCLLFMRVSEVRTSSNTTIFHLTNAVCPQVLGQASPLLPSHPSSLLVVWGTCHCRLFPACCPHLRRANHFHWQLQVTSSLSLLRFSIRWSRRTWPALSRCLPLSTRWIHLYRGLHSTAGL